MPALGEGWAYFVPEKPYMEHVQRWGLEEYVSKPCMFDFCADRPCSRFIAQPMRL